MTLGEGRREFSRIKALPNMRSPAALHPKGSCGVSSVFAFVCEVASFDPVGRLSVRLVDVVLKIFPTDAPHTAPTYLYCPKLTASDKRPDEGRLDV